MAGSTYRLTDRESVRGYWIRIPERFRPFGQFICPDGPLQYAESVVLSSGLGSVAST